MVWGAFSYKSKTPLAVTVATQNAEDYQEHLTNALLPNMRKFGDRNWRSKCIFMQDNARCHTARSTKAFFSAQRMQVMEWPAFSSDLNPIENLWGYLARKVYAGGRQYQTLQELKTVVLEEWQKVPLSLLQDLAMSVPGRLFKVIEAGGSYIN